MSERLSSLAAQSFDSSSSNESSISRKAELEGLEGSAQAALARLAERQQVSGSGPEAMTSTVMELKVLVCHLFHF